MLQPPVVLHSGTAEQQLNELCRELQPDDQRGDYYLQYCTVVHQVIQYNKLFKNVSYYVLYLVVPGGGWGHSTAEGPEHGPVRVVHMA